MSTPEGMRIEPSSRVARSEAVIFTELDDIVVMMDAEQGDYYELDPVASRIWALAESGPRVAEMCKALVAEYEVAPDTCTDEVAVFLDRLCRLKIVRVLPGDDLQGRGGQEARADFLARSIPGKAAAAPRPGSKPRAKLAWTTPDLRVLETRQVATRYAGITFRSETPDYDIYNRS